MRVLTRWHALYRDDNNTCSGQDSDSKDDEWKGKDYARNWEWHFNAACVPGM